MDIALARTFLAVLTAGSFRHAADQLYVTQSAVSLRIARLEQELGREVFTRNKGGAVLTPAGRQFERFARSMVKLWEEANYQVALPEGLDSMLLAGCQYSLWPKLGMTWLRAMEGGMPTASIKAEVGMPDRLLRLMLDGLLDIGVMYTPQLRPGLEVKPLLQDTLVLAATDPEYPPELDDRYVSIEWSPEFIALHQAHFPQHSNSRVKLALGSLSARFVSKGDRAAYFPARTIEDYVETGQLHIISGAPAFPFPVYAVWNPEKDEAALRPALRLLDETVARIERSQTQLIEGAGVDDFDNALSTSAFGNDGS